MLLVPALSLGFIAAAAGPLFLPPGADALSSLCLLFGSCLWGGGSIWLVGIWCECRGQIFLLFIPQTFIDVFILIGSEPIVTECPFSIFFNYPEVITDEDVFLSVTHSSQKICIFLRTKPIRYPVPTTVIHMLKKTQMLGPFPCVLSIASLTEHAMPCNALFTWVSCCL